MKTMNQVLGALLIGATLSGCYVVPASSATRVMASNTGTATAAQNILQARLYPTNDIAQRAGAAQATVAVDQTGHGTFSAQIGGEAFRGDATRMSNSRSGRANGASSSGRYINCEYTMNSATLGTGTCQVSTGATYTMHIAR